MRRQVHVHIERASSAKAKTADCGCGKSHDSAGAGMGPAKKPGAKADVPAPPLTSFKTHGPAGGNLAHHREKSKAHAKKAAGCGDDKELAGLHNSASNSHAMAAHYLQSAQHHEGGSDGMAAAQRHANVAGQYEIKISGHAKKSSSKDAMTTDDWAKWNEEHKKHSGMARAHERADIRNPHPAHRQAAGNHEAAALHLRDAMDHHKEKNHTEAKKSAAIAASHARAAKEYEEAAPLPKEKSKVDLKKHPNYNKEDHAYLKGKGWTESEIEERWTAEHKAGKGPQGHKKAPDVVGMMKGGHRPEKVVKR